MCYAAEIAIWQIQDFIIDIFPIPKVINHKRKIMAILFEKFISIKCLSKQMDGDTNEDVLPQ